MASTLGTHFQDYSVIHDSLDDISIRPDFMILVSPDISMSEHTHKGSVKIFLGNNPTQEMIDLYSNEKQVSEKTPPTFLVHAQNDHVVTAINSIRLFQSMIESDVKGSLHIFPEGDHSIALRNNPGSTNIWTTTCEHWLREINMIE